jgi:hypothetical protein
VLEGLTQLQEAVYGQERSVGGQERQVRDGHDEKHKRRRQGDVRGRRLGPMSSGENGLVAFLA